MNVTIPTYIIVWLGLGALALAGIVGFSLLSKSLSKQKPVQLAVLWGGWALAVCAFVFGQYFNTLRDGRGLSEAHLLAFAVIVAAAVTAVLAANGLTLAEMTAATIFALIVGTYGWYIHHGDSAAIALAATVLVELVVFGSKNIEEVVSKNGRVAAVAQPARWAFVLAALIGIGIVGINLTNGNLSLADTKTARASARATTTTTQKPGTSRPATEAEMAKLNGCYKFEGNTNTITLIADGVAVPQLTGQPVTQWAQKWRAYAGVAIPFRLYTESDKARQYPIIFDVPKCSSP